MSVDCLTGYTPFFLVYGAKAVIPLDLDFNAPCIHFYDEQRAKEQRQTNVDMLEEVRSTAVVRSGRYQHGLRHNHARWVRDVPLL